MISVDLKPLLQRLNGRTTKAMEAVNLRLCHTLNLESVPDSRLSGAVRDD